MFTILTWNVLDRTWGIRNFNRAILSPLGRDIVDAMKHNADDEFWSSSHMDSIRARIAKDANAAKVFARDEIERRILMMQFLWKVCISGREPDVICLQEVSRDMAERCNDTFDKSLTLFSPYPKTTTKDEAGLSCHVLQPYQDNYEQLHEPILAPGDSPSRMCVYVQCTERVICANVHLKGYEPGDKEGRDSNVKEALHYAQKLIEEFSPTHCIVMVGDFNHPVGEEDVLKVALKDQFQFIENMVSPIPTSTDSESRYVKPKPITIDRCFVRNGEVTEITPLQEGLEWSDHVPLIIKVKPI